MQIRESSSHSIHVSSNLSTWGCTKVKESSTKLSLLLKEDVQFEGFFSNEKCESKIKKKVVFFKPIFQSKKISSKITPFYVSLYWHPQLCEWHCKPPQWSGNHQILQICFYSMSTTLSLSDVLVKMSHTEAFRISYRQIPRSRSSPQAAAGGCSSHLAPAAAQGTAVWEMPSKESRRGALKGSPLYQRPFSPNSWLHVQPVWVDHDGTPQAGW